MTIFTTEQDVEFMIKYRDKFETSMGVERYHRLLKLLQNKLAMDKSAKDQFPECTPHKFGHYEGQHFEYCRVCGIRGEQV